VFTKILRSFGYAEQRFNSRSEPFFKLFLLLPTAIDALAELGDKWSRSILNTLGGAHGYDLVVSAALVADVMMFIQPCIREEDTDDGDASHLGSTACKIRDGLHEMLELGTIWLKESEGTCVHAALQAIQGRVVFPRRGWCEAMHSARLARASGHPTASSGKKGEGTLQALHVLFRLHVSNVGCAEWLCNI
jgi:hypothetical protein